MTRKVYIKVNVEDDGSAGLMQIYREEKGGERLTPEEWDTFKESVIERLPDLIDSQSDNEQRHL